MNKKTLSEPRRRLVELMQTLDFGRIHGLAVRNGEPDFGRGFRAVRTVKMAGDNSPGPENYSEDFVLKHEVINLLEHFDRLGDGIMRLIEVKHGLPFIIEIEEDYQA